MNEILAVPVDILPVRVVTLDGAASGRHFGAETLNGRAIVRLRVEASPCR